MANVSLVLCFAVQVYLLAVLAWIILSWVQVPSDHAVGRIQVYLDRIIMPVMLPLQRMIPPLRVGGFAVSLAGIVLIIGLRLLQGFLCR